MINVQDLRIGNWVRHEPYTDDQWTVDLELLTAVALGLLCIDGIALTPDILEGCGFTKSKDGDDDGIEWDEFLKQGDHYSLLLKSDNEGSYYLHGDFGYCQVKYVHHLQNLCHSLTGKELSIELNKVEPKNKKL